MPGGEAGRVSCSREFKELTSAFVLREMKRNGFWLRNFRFKGDCAVLLGLSVGDDESVIDW